MPRFINRVGRTYEKLHVLAHAGLTRRHNWLCVCQCGTFCVIDSCALATGKTRSCGCLWAATVVKHGSWQKRSYHTWKGMRNRCNNPNDKDYVKYGAVGVTVCDAWLDYSVFAQDMGEPPAGMTLDRRDPYGNYEPDNCRWVTLTTQARNIRLPVRNTSGHIGVRKTTGGWRASVTAGGRKYSTRVFAVLEDALQARRHLENQHWGGTA